jgi:RTX calcium-binding nonapeptide repeat (4 copies)/Haemolysin-type calcium binding protein related domain
LSYNNASKAESRQSAHIQGVNMAIINGTAGNDSLVGGSTHDTIRGLAGDDTYLGGGGDDQFEDYYYSWDSLSQTNGSGNDTYVFGLNAGKDVIFENGIEAGSPYHYASDPMDVILIDAGISPADVQFSMRYATQENADLVITSVNNSSELRVWGFFDLEYDPQTGKYSPRNIIEEIRFADGTVETTSSIWAKVAASWAPMEMTPSAVCLVTISCLATKATTPWWVAKATTP